MPANIATLTKSKANDRFTLSLHKLTDAGAQTVVRFWSDSAQPPSYALNVPGDDESPGGNKTLTYVRYRPIPVSSADSLCCALDDRCWCLQQLRSRWVSARLPGRATGASGRISRCWKTARGSIDRRLRLQAILGPPRAELFNASTAIARNSKRSAQQFTSSQCSG